MFKTLFKKKCPFKVGDMVYPKEKFSNLYYLFPKGPLPVISIEEGNKEEGWFRIWLNLPVRKKRTVHGFSIWAKALKK